MTSDNNKEIIAEQAEWINEMARSGPDEDQREAIYDATSFVGEGHVPPVHEDVYTVDAKTGALKFCVDKFIGWSEDVSGERFVSTSQGDVVHIYRDGVYTPEVKGWFKTAMSICNHNADVSIHFTREVMNRLGANMIVDRQKIDTQDTDLTVLNNCILNTVTCEVTHHTPDYITFSKLACDYDPSATCTEWTEFLEYALPKHEQLTLQELFGYCLVRGYPYQVAFFLLGKGGNGKGAAMEVLRAMLGGDNCCAVALQDIGERFYAHDLYGRYAEISGDTSPKALLDTSTYKMLTGGDTMRTEKKGEDSFDFKNHAKIISLLNELMPSADQTDGFFRRFVLIQFDRTPSTGRKKEKEGFEKRIIENELSGVLNWSLEGLKRLRAQGGTTFQLDKGADDCRKMWNTKADHVKAFIDSCCEIGPKRIVASEIFMLAYSMWHEDHYNTPPAEDQATVTKGKVQYGFGASPRKPLAADRGLWMTDGDYERESVRCYTGICLKNTSGHLDVDINYLAEHWDEINHDVETPKGLNTMRTEEGSTMTQLHTDAPMTCAPAGAEIMSLIVDRVAAHGGIITDRLISVTTGMLEERGFDVDDIQFCIKQYSDGHRVFIPSQEVAAA
jgi:putative DNA primase/helicase